MRGILEAKYENFIAENVLEEIAEENTWRLFVDYQFFTQYQPGRLDTDAELLELIAAEVPDFSEIHGAMFLLNGQILSECQDIDELLPKNQKGVFELIFLTTGDWEVFCGQIERVLEEDGRADSEESAWLPILHHMLSREVMLKWRESPKITLVYCTAAKEKEGKYPIEDGFCEELRNKGWFEEVSVVRIDRRKLLDIVNSNENSYTISVDIKDSMDILKIDQVGNAYGVTVSAMELVRLMTTEDGMLRRNLFDDNVRDFQEDTTVNGEIAETLRKRPELFALFNNGVTIVCDSAKIDYRKLTMENPQIVNGCQTCSVIYQSYKKGVAIDDVEVVVKTVGSREPEIVQGIVRGANRQNIVYEEAFETIRDFHKGLEKYFLLNETDGCNKIYYERRSRQYANNAQIKAYQRITFRTLIQGMVALFLNHVEKSHLHEFSLLRDYKDDLFVDGHSYIPYYVTALIYAHVDMYFKTGVLPKNLKNFKMHIALLVKELNGEISPDLSTSEIERYCEKLLHTIREKGIEKCALEACDKFQILRDKWVQTKGETHKYGIKDSGEFRNFLMQELHGTDTGYSVNKQYVGYVLNILTDKNNTLYGFIERRPSNIFFHEFDNPQIDKSYVGKKVSYRITRVADKERAVNVRIVG